MQKLIKSTAAVFGYFKNLNAYSQHVLAVCCELSCVLLLLSLLLCAFSAHFANPVLVENVAEHCAKSGLGLLPGGTGNDFARGLALPADPADAARIAADGTPRTLDLILDDAGGVVVNSVHAGTGAEAARAGAGWKERFGRLGYLVGAIKAIVRPPAVRVRVVVDGQEVCGDRDPILQVALGNGAYVGGGAPLTPGADPSDGLIQVLVSTATGPLARLVYAAGLLIGRHHHRADVHTVSGKVVEVSGQSFWCSTDGELTGPYTSRTWRIDGAAYSLMTGAPAGSPPAPPSGQR